MKAYLDRTILDQPPATRANSAAFTSGARSSSLTAACTPSIPDVASLAFAMAFFTCSWAACGCVGRFNGRRLRWID